MRPRLAAAPLAVAALALVPAAAQACANTNVQPSTPVQLAAAAKSVHCLLNIERRRHGLRRFHWNSRLRKASAWQARDMLTYDYFDHERSGGPSFSRRLTHYGYGRRASGYALGENIAWSTISGSSPRAMVRMWMNSPPHRQNILRSMFRDEGVTAIYSPGEAYGDYADAGPMVIYVDDFGRRF